MKKQNKGFTLTELIIVIVIIGILAAVLIPSLTSYIKKANKSAAEQDALSYYKEYIGTLLDEEDLYEQFDRSSIVVEVNDFYVVIVNGSLKDSMSTDDYNLVKGTDDDCIYYQLVINTNGSKTIANDGETNPTYYKYKLVELD